MAANAVCKAYYEGGTTACHDARRAEVGLLREGGVRGARAGRRAAGACSGTGGKVEGDGEASRR